MMTSLLSVVGVRRCFESQVLCGDTTTVIYGLKIRKIVTVGSNNFHLRGVRMGYRKDCVILINNVILVAKDTVPW